MTDPGNVTMTADHLCLLQGKRPTRVFHGKFLNNNNNNNKKGEEGARRKQEYKIHVLPDRRVEFRSNKAAVLKLTVALAVAPRLRDNVVTAHPCPPPPPNPDNPSLPTQEVSVISKPYPPNLPLCVCLLRSTPVLLPCVSFQIGLYM